MGHSTSAIQKGIIAEFLAKAHFAKQGYEILSPTTHETSYDFLAVAGSEFIKVQVKAVLVGTGRSDSYLRLRNKHGQNRLYKIEDYDLLAGVHVESNRIWIFKSIEINEKGHGETITLETLEGRPVRRRKGFNPIYTGSI